VRTVAEALERLAAHHPGQHIRATALLCQGVATGEADPLLDAGQAFTDIGRPLAAGWAYEEAAALFAESADTAAARLALDSAVRSYQAVGADWDRTRAEARLRAAGIRRRQVRTRPKTGWDALTDTERRIAAMVAEGRSNPDIAAELFLSRRTVRNHVSHILAKLELGSRVELAVQSYDQRSP
jgi:DNA-binding CsgD family transcriptional regulator